MKSKLAVFFAYTTFAAGAFVAPLQASQADVSERRPAATTPTDVAGCGDVSTNGMPDKIIPSISVRICSDCRFAEADRHALLLSYGDAARDAGYIINPMNSNLFTIIETGILANGSVFLKGTIDNKQVTVGDPFPGETLASVAGKLAFIAVAGK